MRGCCLLKQKSSSRFRYLVACVCRRRRVTFYRFNSVQKCTRRRINFIHIEWSDVPCAAHASDAQRGTSDSIYNVIRGMKWVYRHIFCIYLSIATHTHNGAHFTIASFWRLSNDGKIPFDGRRCCWRRAFCICYADKRIWYKFLAENPFAFGFWWVDAFVCLSRALEHRHTSRLNLI